MIEDSLRVLGIIPARGGSKGVARKNIREVAGEPLIAYTIRAAQASARLSYFVTSTEDEEIARVARRHGSPVLMRPGELAADDVTWLPVVKHALHMLEPEHGRFDAVTILQPPTPLRTAQDIDAAIDLLIESRADSVISVYQVEDNHPMRMYRLADGRLVAYEAEPPDRRRQKLPAVYHRNGAIYVSRRALIEELGVVRGGHMRPYIMPRERSLNINDEMDLIVASCLLRYQQRVKAAHS